MAIHLQQQLDVIDKRQSYVDWRYVRSPLGNSPVEILARLEATLPATKSFNP